MTANLDDLAKRHLGVLCERIEDRSVGGEGNRAASDYFEQQIRDLGFAAERQEFSCLLWRSDGATLQGGRETFDLQPGPYGLPCDLSAPVAVATTVEELRALDADGAIVLLRGPIAASQLMPKRFPFYNPPEHREIVGLLEGGGAVAIVAATGIDPGLAGGESPFPLIEDGDFELPTAFMDEQSGERLARMAGCDVALKVGSRRSLSRGCNVVARKGSGPGRIVVCAHIDAKRGTPGAVDNGGGTTVLLLLASLLADYDGTPAVEIVSLNGEDHYAVPGQVRFLALNEGRLDDVCVAVNLDGVGYRVGKTAFSLYGCPPELDSALRETFAAHAGLTEGPAWYQGDHSMFIQNCVPAAALTTEALADAWVQIAHTSSDTVDQIDCAKLAEAAVAIRQAIHRIAAG